MDTNKLKELAERAVDDFGSFDPSEAEQEFMEQITPQAVLELIAEVERLRSALQSVHAEVDGNIRPLTRDLVNMVSGMKNGSHPNDIYDHCEEIDRIIDAALEGGGR